MAALLLNTLSGNAVLPLDSSTTRKAHREVCVATHIRAPVDKETPHESARTRAEHVGARTGGLGGSSCVNSTPTHATSLGSGFVLVRLLIGYLRRADEHG